jgi:hypothetical protein
VLPLLFPLFTLFTLGTLLGVEDDNEDEGRVWVPGRRELACTLFPLLLLLLFMKLVGEGEGERV